MPFPPVANDQLEPTGIGPTQRRPSSEGACVHWFRIDGPVGELYDVAVVPGVMRPMSLSFASNEVLGLITHDPLDEGGFFA